jgi:hypothetical protein
MDPMAGRIFVMHRSGMGQSLPSQQMNSRFDIYQRRRHQDGPYGERRIPVLPHGPTPRASRFVDPTMKKFKDFHLRRKIFRDRTCNTYKFQYVLNTLTTLQVEMTMTLDRTILAFAGIMTLLSVALTTWVHPNFVWFTVFIGANLLQSAFTGFCPAALVFKKLGCKPGTAF